MVSIVQESRIVVLFVKDLMEKQGIDKIQTNIITCTMFLLLYYIVD